MMIVSVLLVCAMGLCGAADTRIDLGETEYVTLGGSWQLRSGLLSRYTVLESEEDGAFHVLGSGDWSSDHVAIEPGAGGGIISPDPTISPDHSGCYFWLDKDRQLVRYDFDTRAVRSLTSLPVTPHRYGRGEMLNPFPLLFGPSAAFDSSAQEALIVTKGYGSSPGYTPYKRAYWVGVGRGTNNGMSVAFAGVLPDEMHDWAYAPSDACLYGLVSDEGPYRPGERRWVVRLTRSGERSVVVEHLPGTIEWMYLAPGRHRLLLVRAFDPDVKVPEGDRQDMTSAEKSVVDSALGGGFAVWDLARSTVIGEVSDGYEARWVGDEHVLHMDGRAVHLYDIPSGRSEVLLEVRSTTRRRPAMRALGGSADGAIALVRVGTDHPHLLALNLETREYALWPGAAQSAVVSAERE